MLCVMGWAIPGAAHFWLGRRQKAIVFLVALTAMFVIGLLLHGQIFPLDLWIRLAPWLHSRTWGSARRGSLRA